MIIKNRVHYCEKGEMPLSEHFDNILSAAFEDRNERSFPGEDVEKISPRSFFCLNARCPERHQTYFDREICPACNSTLRESTYYCPQCGVPMKNESGGFSADVSCVVCQKNLTNEMRYQMVERHPHNPQPKDFKPFPN